MRQTSKVWLLATMAATMFWASLSEAAFFGLLRAALRYQLARTAFDNPVLPLVGHIRFCLKYPDDCRVNGIDFHRRNMNA